MGDRKTMAIIQARMGSSRLPGKVLMDISGKPMVWHVINRLKGCKWLDRIIVATSTSFKDDPVETFCRSNEVLFFRGSEKDVLDRYYQAAKKYKANVVVRITADCPLIDPETVDRVIEGYLSRIDYFDVASNVIERTYPRGLDVEVFSFEALKKCWQTADKGYQREHVTPYFYENSDKFKMFNVKSSEDLSLHRWTVDEESDLTMVRKIFENFKGNKNIFSASDIVTFFKTRPDVKAFNENVEQKKII